MWINEFKASEPKRNSTKVTNQHSSSTGAKRKPSEWDTRLLLETSHICAQSVGWDVLSDQYTYSAAERTRRQVLLPSVPSRALRSGAPLVRFYRRRSHRTDQWAQTMCFSSQTTQKGIIFYPPSQCLLNVLFLKCHICAPPRPNELYVTSLCTIIRLTFWAG